MEVPSKAGWFINVCNGKCQKIESCDLELALPMGNIHVRTVR